MKKLLAYLVPLFLAIVTFLFYVIVYRPSVQSEDFSTALLVAFAALGSSAIIILSAREPRWLMPLYAVTAVIFPLVLLFFVKISAVNSLFHPLLLGLIALAFIVLRLFVAYVKSSRTQK